MDLEVIWHKPIPLKDASASNLIYTIDDLADWKDVCGVYMFCRLYAEKITPLYIGKAANIGRRLKQQFEHNTKLMLGIDNAVKGKKVLIIGDYVPRSGQSIAKSLGIIESALIEHALFEGHSLLNIQGTKTPVHELSFLGFHGAKAFTGPKIYKRSH